MSDPTPPIPRTSRPPIIVGGKVNPKAKPTKAPFRQKEEAEQDFDESDESDGLEDESSLLSAPSRGGPGSSIFKWMGGRIFVRLLRLGVKLIPVTGALVGATYGYTYFFGSIPILESIKAELGFAVVQEEPQQSRVNQMLQRTRDSIATNDSKIHLGNAIAAGDIETADALENGELVITREPPKTQPIQTRVEPKKAAEPILSNALDSIVSVFSSDDDTESAETPDSSATGSPYEDYEQTVTVVQDTGGTRSRFRNINYQSGPAASAEFGRWMQSIRIGQVTSGFRPSIQINGETFHAGTIMDFALGVTFEGLADNDTLLVFKEQRGGFITVRF